MGILLDTLFLYWLMQDRSAVERLLGRQRVPPVVSVVSLWEMRLKHQSLRPSGERKSPHDPAAVLQALEDLRTPVLGMEAGDVMHPLVPLLAHRDPFDELLLCQAQRRNLRLATTDGKLLEHPGAIRLPGT